ncbi:MAG: hypothetical protein ACK4MI_06785 [Brevundimonas sp.]|uniref:hypothetical protein n=1 Tax=Brevundimonas sp. TaxID=1871086 RepID=UPI0028D305D2|nr:hypothetical protein [uncultured Brevundimonas sp.]
MRVSLVLSLACALGALASTASAQSDGAIDLVCTGQGQRMENRSTETLEWDRDQRRYHTQTGTETSQRDYSAAVTIQIDGDQGRIRLPETMLPDLHSGGDSQHWWTLRDISVGPNEIRAHYRLNFANSPDIMIDRRTGDLTISGLASDFTGSCQRVDPDQRRF